ncbi:DUF1579 family protein [Rhodohalobacter sp.]|uniref:DUF1579 family protein n=1 Tax=Rhodohalobacter sp. TaxID=1974210 RepID=UPI002ACE312C|nr:DUF1579 family protein [Rhodohalobacter sp.]MDZ7757699.1 DUF1579 family protein [Rhodohalobacter sp.]
MAVLLIVISQADPILGQTSSENTSPEYAFDFWLGEWELTWQNGDGTTATGKNTVRRILGGHVIEENFEALTGDMAGYEGKSYSVYNPQTGEWKQTWVDNGGSYLDFTGDITDGNRIFHRTAFTAEGDRFLQRMHFYDITEDSLSWDWERSLDEGETWELMWRIQYRRSLAK